MYVFIRFIFLTDYHIEVGNHFQTIIYYHFYLIIGRSGKWHQQIFNQHLFKNAVLGFTASSIFHSFVKYFVSQNVKLLVGVRIDINIRFLSMSILK